MEQLPIIVTLDKGIPNSSAQKSIYCIYENSPF